jgi:hypothetical protein
LVASAGEVRRWRDEEWRTSVRVRETYTRCSGGCLFSGERCPLDGWASPATLQIFRLKLALRAAGVEPTLERLRAELAGSVDQLTLELLVEVAFPDKESVLSAFAPVERH